METKRVGHNLVEVTFRWTDYHGPCYDCGLPAAFFGEQGPTDHIETLCAICAANRAADGEEIERIEPLD